MLIPAATANATIALLRPPPAAAYVVHGGRAAWGILEPMSQVNVDMVRRIYADGLIDRDPEWLLDLATPDIDYVNPPNAVEPGVRRGPAEVVRAMRGFAEPWTESRHELHELFDCGDAVVAAVTWTTRSHGSEMEITQAEAHTWTFRGGRIARFEWGQDVASALRAAGD